MAFQTVDLGWGIGQSRGERQGWGQTTMKTEAAEAPEPMEQGEPVMAGVKLSETLGLVMALRSRADNDWYRVIYLHAALIAVMVFFAGQKPDFLVARLVVFAFYSFNVLVSFGTLRETHQGLAYATADLRSFPLHQGGAAVQGWLGARDYAGELRWQLTVLGAVWLLVAYLLLSVAIFGRAP
ncbi:MAG: hypothetical protein ABI832_08740 [bacterium]